MGIYIVYLEKIDRKRIKSAFFSFVHFFCDAIRCGCNLEWIIDVFHRLSATFNVELFGVDVTVNHRCATGSIVTEHTLVHAQEVLASQPDEKEKA